MFKQSYSQSELEKMKANNLQRKGWDFSVMKTEAQTRPWNYQDVVAKYLTKDDFVLDIGTGGGENFLKLANLFNTGMGIDIDPEMIKVASENSSNIHNVSFKVDNEKLENISEIFDVILNRHAPFYLETVKRHLAEDGYFITQQVGERNMLNIKQVLNSYSDSPVISSDSIAESGLTVIAFMEYDVEYVVKDVESLIFWLQALDEFHTDLKGGDALKDVQVFNKIFEGNVDERGFITNEHRYLVIAQNKS